MNEEFRESGAHIAAIPLQNTAERCFTCFICVNLVKTCESNSDNLRLRIEVLSARSALYDVI